MNIRNTCPLCDSNEGKLAHTIEKEELAKFIDMYYGRNSFNKLSIFIDQHLEYVKCQECNLIFQKNILVDDGMYELYENLIDPIKSLKKRTSTSLILNFRSIFLIFSLLRRVDKEISEIITVDIGMGFGNMLNQSKALGCVKSYGIELSQLRIDYAKETFGIDSFSNLEIFDDNSVDLILSNQSLEHIPNLREMLDAIERKLSVGGFVYIAVPNGLKKEEFLQKGIYHPLEHVNTFIPNSKKFLFSSNMKYKFMLKNLRTSNGTVWLFQKNK